jgi:Trk K+ transport system NAD-binding subunit
VLIVGAGDIGGHVKEVLNALGATVTLVGRQWQEVERLVRCSA